MNDHAQNASGALTDQDIVDLTQRPSDAYNEVVLQADYTTRATLSFYRFRQLGGDYRVHYTGRDASPAPAVGYAALHVRQQQADANAPHTRRIRPVAGPHPAVQGSVPVAILGEQELERLYAFAAIEDLQREAWLKTGNEDEARGAILDLALRYSLGLPEAAAAVDQAVDDVLAAGIRTADISGSGPAASTHEMGNAVARALAM